MATKVITATTSSAYHYYYRADENNVIKYLGKAKKVPSTCVEITKDEYNQYKAILSGVEQREGYDAIVTLYTDFSYTVEYIPVEVTEEE